MPAFFRKHILKIALLLFSLPLFFQACCPSDGCDEFCSGFQLRLSFQQDSTKTPFFSKNVMDSMFVIRTVPGRTDDTLPIGSNVIFTFSTLQNPSGFQFRFFSLADSTINIELDSIQSIVRPEKCCRCGELSATEFNLNEERQRVPRGETFMILP